MISRRTLLAASGAQLVAAPVGAVALTIPCERDDCRLVTLGGSVTLLGWHAEVDKHGQPRGTIRDPNTYTYHQKCNTCGRQFVRAERAGDISSWAEVTPKGAP